MTRSLLPGIQPTDPVPAKIVEALRARPDLWRRVAHLCADASTAEPCWHDQRSIRTGGACRMNTAECPP